MTDRVVLVGAPRSGKSTYARHLRGSGVPTWCTDPRSLCKEPEPGVTYLPEQFATPDMWSPGSRFVADEWLTMPGPWCIEGVGTVRALRKVIDDGRIRILDGVRVVRFEDQYEDAVTLPGQRTMAKHVDKIWGEIAHELAHITEIR